MVHTVSLKVVCMCTGPGRSVHLSDHAAFKAKGRSEASWRDERTALGWQFKERWASGSSSQWVVGFLILTV